MSDGQWAITIKQKTNGKWRTLPCCPKLLKHFYDMLELCSQWPTLRNGNLEFILNMVLVLSASVKDRQIWKIWEYKLWTVVQDLASKITEQMSAWSSPSTTTKRTYWVLFLWDRFAMVIELIERWQWQGFLCFPSERTLVIWYMQMGLS
jgi:hypothetical protein